MSARYVDGRGPPLNLTAIQSGKMLDAWLCRRYVPLLPGSKVLFNTLTANMFKVFEIDSARSCLLTWKRDELPPPRAMLPLSLQELKECWMMIHGYQLLHRNAMRRATGCVIATLRQCLIRLYMLVSLPLYGLEPRHQSFVLSFLV